MRHLVEMPVTLHRLIAGIEVNEQFEGVGKQRKQVGWTKKVRLRDTVRVLELIGKHIDIYRITVRNIEALEVALKDGRGFVVLSGHLGNVELGMAMINAFGYETYGIYIHCAPTRSAPGARRLAGPSSFGQTSRGVFFQGRSAELC